MEKGHHIGGSNPPPSFVEPDCLYRLDEAKSRMGWRDASFRAAVRAGLKVHRAGKRIYLLGADLIAYVTKANGGGR